MLCDPRFEATASRRPDWTLPSALGCRPRLSGLAAICGLLGLLADLCAGLDGRLAAF